MRDTGPVTQNEYVLNAEQTLVSVTDPHGTITYCNPAFVEVSGYADAELLGQPHNIVRHPDMPREAFRDLWDTVAKGLPWDGVVKNRRKNGDHYWVHANVTPMLDGTRITGYLSVRTCPSREQVEAASALYRDLQSQANSGRIALKLARGQVVRVGTAGALKKAFSWDAVRQTQASIVVATAATWATSLYWPWWGTALVALSTGGAALLVMQRRLTAPLHRLAVDARHLGAGDLIHTVRRDGKGVLHDIQRGLHQMGLNMRTVVLDARRDVSSIASMVQEVSAGNQDLCARTENQASSLEETAASMEEINGTVAMTTDSAGRGASLAREANGVAQTSHDAVQLLAKSMDDIRQSSQKINDIIQVVEGVAFQTNILALNAAVEAARAGESGRGFAVVASEVRALAQRTADAAKEIKQLIQDAVEKVAAGDAQTRHARERMDDAIAAVGSVNSVLEEITRAAHEQQTGIDQINQAIQNMDSVTQQNAAMVEELAATATSMLQQVEKVRVSTRIFRLKRGEETVAEMDVSRLVRAAPSAPITAQDEFDFSKAIEAHHQWKVKLRNAIDSGEKLDADTVSRDDCCPLGKWLHGPGRETWGRAPRFVKLVDSHAAFHRAAGEVARVINGGQHERALQLLTGGTRFAEATIAVVSAIRSLQHQPVALPA